VNHTSIRGLATIIHSCTHIALIAVSAGFSDGQVQFLDNSMFDQQVCTPSPGLSPPLPRLISAQNDPASASPASLRARSHTVPRCHCRPRSQPTFEDALAVIHKAQKSKNFMEVAAMVSRYPLVVHSTSTTSGNTLLHLACSTEASRPYFMSLVRRFPPSCRQVVSALSPPSPPKPAKDSRVV